jgi:NADPH:quinone reductase-like Zn-dependent oxidoreductase
MKKILIMKHGGPEVMQLVDGEPLALPPDAVRIRVKAAGINFADLMMRMGLYPEAPKTPFVPGYEVAGEVSAVGPAVLPGTFKIGDRVCAALKFGGYATDIVVSAAQVRVIPADMSFEDAASIPVNWGTAWIALMDMARVRAGDRVLVHSAAGGVGIAAVQIATAAGATVVGLTGSPSKAGAVHALGAKEVWSNEDWVSSKRDGERFDVILEAIGGPELKRCYSRLHHTGRVVTFGVSSIVGGEKRSLVKAAVTMLRTPIFMPIRLMNTNRGVFGLNMLKMFDDMDRVASALDRILDGFREKKFRAVVGKTFPLAEAGAAHRHLQGRGNVGKVVLTCD